MKNVNISVTNNLFMEPQIINVLPSQSCRHVNVINMRLSTLAL